MKKASTKQPKPLPKLERLLIDADIKATILSYLRVVGFNVVFVKEVPVNYQDDAAILRYARRHKRILVCHDRYRDKETKHRICLEIYKHGGQVIQISGSPAQPVLTSLGKLLAYRTNWLAFFSKNDGIVTLYNDRYIKTLKRANLIQQVQGTFNHPTMLNVNPKAPRSTKTAHKSKQIAKEQQYLIPQNTETS